MDRLIKSEYSVSRETEILPSHNHGLTTEPLLYRGLNHLLFQKYIFLYLNRHNQKSNDVTVAASRYRIDSFRESKSLKQLKLTDNLQLIGFQSSFDNGL